MDKKLTANKTAKQGTNELSYGQFFDNIRDKRRLDTKCSTDIACVERIQMLWKQL